LRLFVKNEVECARPPARPMTSRVVDHIARAMGYGKRCRRAACLLA
jgi:hypothetical protein